MRVSQRLLFLLFVLTSTMRLAMLCFALNQVITILGSEQLSTYYAYSAMVAVASVLGLTLVANRIASPHRFLLLHSTYCVLALGCFVSENMIVSTQLLFLSIVGLGDIIYFSNWSLASLYISPFESKRLYPLMATGTQIGIFLAAPLAMAASIGLTTAHYFAIWAFTECVIVAIGVALILRVHSEQTPTRIATPRAAEPISPKRLFRQYRLIPRITLWTFFCGLIFYSLSSLTGATFDRSGVNLTALYGAILMAIGIVSTFSAYVVYPRLVRVLRISAILFAASLVMLGIGTLYLLYDVLALAMFVAVSNELIKGSFINVTLSTKFGLYPAKTRDRIRLLAEILAMSTGASCVGLLFLLPSTLVPWALVGIMLLFACLGYGLRTGYIRELVQFLHSGNEEEKANAIALFDMLEVHEGYNRMTEIIMADESESLAAKVSALQTFAHLGAAQPAPQILTILQSSAEEPLKLAALTYFDHIIFTTLDPLLRFQVIEALKTLFGHTTSQRVRSKVVHILVKVGTTNSSIGFIVDTLHDTDARVAANAIEGLSEIQYPGTIPLLQPFLEHTNARVRANTIVALWKYTNLRDRLEHVLEQMLQDSSAETIASAIYAMGEIQDMSRLTYLRSLLSSHEPILQRGVPIALIKLGDTSVASRITHMILGDDDTQASNICYLSLRLKPRILHEQILWHIYKQGASARTLAATRYQHCGGFCRDEVALLVQ